MDISIDLQEDVALITMDDGKKNAIDLQALADLNVALDKAEADAKAVVLAGRPGSFCAGFDLATMTRSDMKAIMALGQGGGKLALRLWSLPKPLVAACTGHAFTIADIANWCSVRTFRWSGISHGDEFPSAYTHRQSVCPARLTRTAPNTRRAPESLPAARSRHRRPLAARRSAASSTATCRATLARPDRLRGRSQRRKRWRRG